MSAVAFAASYLAAAALAWAIARRERVQRPIAVYFALLSAAWASEAVAGALGDRTLETARVAITWVATPANGAGVGLPSLRFAPLIASLGLWAIARVVMERRSARVPLAIGAALAVAGAVPALSELRAPSQQVAWVVGTLGAMVSIQRAMRRGDEPALAHLVVLGLTALGAAQIVIGRTEDWTELVPSAAGAGAAVLAQALWLARATKKRSEADDDRAERVRADERVGDLVDLEAALRGRAARDARAARGRLEP